MIAIQRSNQFPKDKIKSYPIFFYSLKKPLYSERRHDREGNTIAISGSCDLYLKIWIKDYAKILIRFSFKNLFLWGISFKIISGQF